MATILVKSTKEVAIRAIMAVITAGSTIMEVVNEEITTAKVADLETNLETVEMTAEETLSVNLDLGPARKSTIIEVVTVVTEVVSTRNVRGSMIGIEEIEIDRIVPETEVTELVAEPTLVKWTGNAPLVVM